MHQIIHVAISLNCLVAPVTQGDGLVIINRGRSTYEIVVASDSLSTTRLAAEELRRYVNLATGVKLPIVRTPTAGKRQIYIASTDRLKPHGFAIQAHLGNLYLRGHDGPGRGRSVDYTNPIHRGTCNAVYEFLERFAGVRWFWSDALGELVPRSTRIVVPADLVIKQEPIFDYRALVYGPPGSSDGDWARRNRLGSEIGMHHSHALQRILPVQEWARRGHPEYAAMRAGTRRIKPARGGSGGHVCTGNPEVVAIVADAAKAYFAGHPRRQMYSISLPDGSSVCTCPVCTRYDVPGYKVPSGVHEGWPVITDRILHFYNSVAKIVARKFPDRFLGGYIYMDYLHPPRRVQEVHPMLALVVSPNQAVELWNDDTWAFYQNLFQAWGGFHDRVYAYDTCFLSRRMYALPAPLGQRAVDLIRLLADSGIRGAYLYIGPTWESLGPDSYLLARLLWNPNADVDRIKREYYGLLYQQASGPVRDYFERAERCWREGTTHDRGAVTRLARAFHRSKVHATEAFAELLIGYTPGLADLERHLQAAEQAAGGDQLVKRRVARLRDNFTLTVTTITGLQAVVDYERDPSRGRKHLTHLAHAINARHNLLRRVGLTYSSALQERLQFADANVHSPLEFGGYYHKLATR